MKEKNEEIPSLLVLLEFFREVNIMIDFEFHNPVQIYAGENALQKLGELTAGKKVLFVYGEASLKASGNYEKLMKAMQGAHVIDFGGHKGPSYQEALQGIELAKKEKAELVLGVGGSAVMDMAKIIAFGVYRDDLWDYLTFQKDPHGEPHLPVYEIPTYPAGGSEVDSAAETDDEVSGEHGSLYGCQSDVAFLIPSFTYGLNKELTAYSGMETLVQLSADYFGNTSSLQKKQLLVTILEVKKAIDVAMAHPGDEQARGTILWGASLSTLGIFEGGNGQLIYSTEGVGEELGLKYREALCLYFPRFLYLIGKGNEGDVREYLDEVWGVSSDTDTLEEILEEGSLRIEAYAEARGVKMGMEEFGIPYEEAKLKKLIHSDCPEEIDEEALFLSWKKAWRE